MAELFQLDIACFWFPAYCELIYMNTVACKSWVVHFYLVPCKQCTPANYKLKCCKSPWWRWEHWTALLPKINVFVLSWTALKTHTIHVFLAVNLVQRWPKRYRGSHQKWNPRSRQFSPLPAQLSELLLHQTHLLWLSGTEKNKLKCGVKEERDTDNSLPTC